MDPIANTMGCKMLDFGDRRMRRNSDTGAVDMLDQTTFLSTLLGMTFSEILHCLLRGLT